MSNAYAIGSVTAVLRRLLNQSINTLSYSDVKVMVAPPDRMDVGMPEPHRLNLFLYQTSFNQGYSNLNLPAADYEGRQVANPPLALNLHYLLTAYGEDEFVREVLLGHGMQALHDRPVLTREFIRQTWAEDTSGALAGLASAGVAEQIELIKLTPQVLSSEELSRLWTITQAKYRPTVAYIATVLLIEGRNSTQSPLPVLRQGSEDRGPYSVLPPFPSLTSAEPASDLKMPAVRLGDSFFINGDQLERPFDVMLKHQDLRVRPDSIEVTQVKVVKSTQLRVTLPTPDPQVNRLWSAGMYSVFLRVQRDHLPPWITNEVALPLSPLVTLQPEEATEPLRVAAGNFITLIVEPIIRADQRWEVFVGMHLVAGATLTNPNDPYATEPDASVITFAVPAMPLLVNDPGIFTVRVRVDGIDSIPVRVVDKQGDRSIRPQFEFDPRQQLRLT